eukprot:3936483-Rhodomonas_salina.2
MDNSERAVPATYSMKMAKVEEHRGPPDATHTLSLSPSPSLSLPPTLPPSPRSLAQLPLALNSRTPLLPQSGKVADVSFCRCALSLFLAALARADPH